MKFLQFVADYGEADVTTLNERDLTASRALKRPQNKQHDDKLTTTFDQYASFTDVLSTHFKLSAALQQVVRYAVLLQPTSPHPSVELSTSDSLDAIFAFVTSIGKFAPSPYLTPMYGISEVAQSFCRLSAVYNGTYILRTSLSHLDVRPSVDDATSGGHLDVRPPPVDETTSSGHVDVRASVDDTTSSGHLDVRPSVDGTTSGDLCVGMSTTDGKSFRAKHVVLNASSYAHSIGYTPHTALLRGIFVVDTSIQVGVDRLVLVLPPGEVAHPNAALSGSWAVHVLQMDSTMGVCASGTFLIHVTTVAPLDTPAEDLVSYMHAIYACLYPANAVTPVWSAVFTIPSSITSPTTTRSLANVHVCPSPPLLDTTLATCVADARAIFRAICPEETLLFLPKSEEAHAEAGNGADSDSDVALLDQAAQLLQTSVTEAGKRSIEDHSKGEVAVLSSTSSTSSTVNGSNDSP
ncbi:hypothetical protein, variant [Aphanomyces astaci]|nr:hypothetical protein, variant [Aphanomyces astaci]ETV76798.1 hypothetical protein, variant [Aphanomyces astaci]|eukprot:XP_009833709.1 hypothetical protein, variant [Aphanomyces astaci]